MVYYNLAADQRINKRNESLRAKKLLNIDSKIESLESTDLNELKWVWEETIKILFEHWITCKEDLIKAWKEKVEKIKVPFLSRRWVMSVFNK